MIASGFFALLVTADYGIVMGALFALIIVAGWRIDSGQWRIQIPPLWWNLATVAFLLLSVANAVFSRRMQAMTMVNILLFLQAVKILTPKRNRDYVTIYIISFVQLLASTIMTYSILFAVSCMLFAISMTWALITLYLKIDIETHLLTGMPADAEPEERLRKEREVFNLPAVNNLLNHRFFTGIFAITLLTFGLALVIFIVLPRAREGIFFMYGAELSQQVSGFSEAVDLNTFGNIRMNHQPVMRVTLPENIDPARLEKELYWKGLAFDYYDGERWKAEPKRWKRIPVQSRFDRFYWFIRQKDRKGLVPQTIELASVNFEVVFGADVMRAVKGKFLSLHYDIVTGNAKTVYDPYNLTYTVYSDLSQPTEAQLRTAGPRYPDEIAAYYLQIPEVTERVWTLARQLGENQATPYDRALAVQNYLAQNYTYSLNVQRSTDMPLLEDFLFVNKAGHCEFYATAMTILLRLQGIPARVVNGFARGRWNEFGHFFTVRQSDAHSWVEVYFPSFGWIQFDPTPGAAFGESYQEFVEKESLLASLYRYSEYLRVRWNHYIIDYDREDQAQAVLSAFLASRSASRNLRTWFRRQGRRLERVKQQFSRENLGRILGMLGASVLLAYGISRLLKRWRIRIPWFRWRKRRAKATYVVRFYHQMRRILARKGVSLAASATPGEFARYVAQDYAVYAQDVQAVTDLYYAVRYGHIEITQEQLQRITTALRNMKKHRRS